MRCRPLFPVESKIWSRLCLTYALWIVAKYTLSSTSRTNQLTAKNLALLRRVFFQIYGVDYFETFSPVAHINSICILISLAVNLDWSLFQLVIKNAFYMVIYKRKCIWNNLQGMSRGECSLQTQESGLWI